MPQSEDRSPLLQQRIRDGGWPVNSRLTFPDVFRVGSLGLRSRRLRALLSALGVSIGIAAIVGVLGISASSQARLLAQLDALGTNLLTVAPGQVLGGGQAYLPRAAPGMIGRVGPVLTVSATGTLPDAHVFRTDSPCGRREHLAACRL